MPPDWDRLRSVIYDDVDRWGRDAAHFIKVYRRAAGVGPSFSELFREITPELAILRFEGEPDAAQRRYIQRSFKEDIAFTLMLAGWIHYGRTERSLQTARKAKQIPPCGIHCINAHFVTSRHWAVNIRKFASRIRDLGTLVELGSLSQPAAEFLRVAVLSGCNILVSGATQSGKTTMLNALLSAVRPGERIVTVEETFELDLGAPDHVAMQCRQPSLEGVGEITLRRLIKEALRMRPDRLVVGEVREAESLDLLIALNSGLPGMSSIHANGARDALIKLSTLPLLAGRNIDSSFVVPTVAASIDVVVHCELTKEGRRRVVEIAAPSGRVTDSLIESHILFELRHNRLEATGEQPTRVVKFRRAGFDVPAFLSGVAR